jgi:hypothetical protein
MQHYEVTTSETIVRLEYSRSWIHGVFYSLFTLIVFVLDGSPPSDPPMSLVVRERVSGKVLYSDGPYFGAAGVDACNEALRVIEVLGVQGYIAREES